MATVQSIQLASLQGCVERLVNQVTAGGFQPSVIVFIERAARVPAVLAARRINCALIPLHIQRKSTKWKSRMAPIAGKFPAWFTDRLRTLEASMAFGKRRRRHVELIGTDFDLAGHTVLILDDAADTGSSLLQARAWSVAHGADNSAIRTCALTVTTALAREAVDFYLFDNLCRFPWSSDSTEVAAHESFYEALAGEVTARMQVKVMRCKD